MKDGDNMDSKSEGGGEEYNNSIIPMSRCRHNYHDRTETAMNRQINLYLHASYVYTSMVSNTI